MIRRIGRKTYKIYGFDIESHNDEVSKAKRETSMWLGVLMDETGKVDDESIYHYNMDSVLDKLEELTRTCKKHKKDRPCDNVMVYIHNLSFEYSFLLPYLLKRGFKYKEEINDDDEMVFNSVSNVSCRSVWTCSFKFSKNHGIVVLKDLCKIFPDTLENVAKSFGLKTQKGKIDYLKNRLDPNYKVTDEEKKYCYDDVRILLEILMKMDEKNDKLFWKSSSISTYAISTMVARGYSKSYKPYASFRQDYPNLDEKENAFLRKAVEGGICYPCPKYQFKDISNILHIDLHQAYPSACYFNEFPYGYGKYFTGKPKYNPFVKEMACCRVLVSYDDVKLHSKIKLIGIDFICDKEITVWDFEIELMKKCYVNLKVKYLDGYMYKTKRLKWRDVYNENYEKRKIAKKENDLFNIMLYKLINNSSYGKLLERPHNTLIENCIGIDNVITSKVVDKDSEDIEVEAKYTYLPVGSTIPAFVRKKLVETALMLGWENIIYFDTDSIFCVYNEETKRVWETKINKRDELGGWGLEEIAKKGSFSCSKRYKILTEVKGKDTVIIKAGGINFDGDNLSYDINLNFNEFEVKRSFRCKGGTIIDIQRKKVAVQPKHIEIYKHNKGCPISILACPLMRAYTLDHIR